MSNDWGRRLSLAMLGVAIVAVALSTDAKACANDAGTAAQAPGFIHPAPGKLMTAFGQRIHPLLNARKDHNGIDYFAEVGDPIVAAASGEVRFAENKGQFGIAIEIRHDAGWQTFYAHLSRPDVRSGDCVKVGDPIGAAGNTGFSTGPHLHFEILQNGALVDPASLLDMTGRECVIVCPADRPCACEPAK
jgi:murein DD-endopeptidase MepM/ murein hydrolase activator NlpD